MYSNSTIKSDDWQGCYKKGWMGILVPDAFAHPAKVSFGLADRIYQHAIEEGWLKPGDVVIDPFGGIGGFAFHAMLNGLHFQGVELEPRFVELGGKNIDLWNARYGPHLPRWGSARLIQGDSRELVTVLAGAGACVSSPPYSHPAKGIDAGEMDNKMRHINTARLERGDIKGGVGRSGRLGASILAPHGYSDNPSNLGNLPATDAGYRAAISSPPYAESLNSKGNGIDQSKFKDQSKARAEWSPHNNIHIDQAYGTSPGQLGAMKSGDFKAAISSPPYAEARIDGNGDEGASGLRNPDGSFLRGKDGWEKRKEMGQRYGNSEGNLGGMKAGDFSAAVSSPPFSQPGMQPEAKHQGVRTYYTEQGRTPESTYGVSPGQLGGMKAGDFQAAVSSPPYQTGGNHDHQMDAWNTNGRGQSGHSGGYAEESPGQLQGSGDDFWTAARLIVEQVYQVLAPGGAAIWVTKRFVKDKKIVEFSQQWAELCEAVGFQVVHWHKAWLIEDKGTQYDLFGNGHKKVIARKSFFRRLAESKGSPAIDWEDVICMRK